MNKIILLMGLLLFGFDIMAQNVGIGTITPQAKLDVKGNLRIGGGSNFLSYDSLSGKFSWTNSYLFLPNAQYIIQHSASSEGLYYGSSQLEYRYQDGTPRFFTNWSTGNGYFYGNLGIGNLDPIYPLNFSASTGDKISLWNNPLNGVGPNYGFGIQSLTLQIHTDGNGSDIAFGYGSSSSFTETMRMKGTGVLQFPASLSKKIILYPGSVGDAGFSVFANELRIASDYSGADITFGYDNRSTSFTEKFRMKASGALAVNGNAGSAGQVLQSNGAGASPQWSNKPYVLSYFNTAAQTLLGGGSINVLPVSGIDGSSFTLTQASDVVVTLSTELFANNCNLCADSYAFVVVTIGTPSLANLQLTDYSDVKNQTYMSYSASSVTTLNPGTYNIAASFQHFNGSNGEMDATIGAMKLILQVYPH